MSFRRIYSNGLPEWITSVTGGATQIQNLLVGKCASNGAYYTLLIFSNTVVHSILIIVFICEEHFYFNFYPQIHIRPPLGWTHRRWGRIWRVFLLIGSPWLWSLSKERVRFSAVHSKIKGNVDHFVYTTFGLAKSYAIIKWKVICKKK